MVISHLIVFVAITESAQDAPSFDSGGEFEPPALRSIFLSQMSCQVALFLLCCWEKLRVKTSAHRAARKQLLPPDPQHTNQ